MSAATLSSLSAAARRSLTDVIWRQWAAIGAPAASRQPARAVVDPEALLLASLALREQEYRFSDLISAWTEHWARLLSVQRVKNLIKTYPEPVGSMVASFARFAWKSGADARWKSLAAADSWEVPRKSLKTPPVLMREAALVLRLRLAFGVNMRADLLTFFITTQRKHHTVQSVGRSLSYTNAATRRALDDLVAAAILRQNPGARPATFSAPIGGWVELLELHESLPQWVDWRETFGFLLALDAWNARVGQRDVTGSALESLGSELWLEHDRRGVGALMGEAAGPRDRSFADRVTRLCQSMMEVV